MKAGAKNWYSKIWRQRINIRSCNAYSVCCYPNKQKEIFLKLPMHYVYLTSNGYRKTESNYEEENKSVEYRQTEYLMKVVRELMFQKKFLV